MSSRTGVTGKAFQALALAGVLGLALCPFAALAADEGVRSPDVPVLAIDAPPMPEVDHPAGQALPEEVPTEVGVEGGVDASGEAISAEGHEGVAGSDSITEEGHAEEGHSAGGVGFPQLDPSTYASQVFWLAVAFALLYGLMSRIALPRIEDVIERRRAQREGDLNQAEQFKSEAAKIRSSYEGQLARAQSDAQALLAEAEADIKEVSKARNAAFAENARKRIALSEEAIGRARDAALAQVPDVAADIAADAVSKVAGFGVSKADAKKIVQSLDREVA